MDQDKSTISYSASDESYIKTDNNIIINERSIRWVKKINECLLICSRMDGCNTSIFDNTHKVCQYNNPISYNKLNKHFD